MTAERSAPRDPTSRALELRDRNAGYDAGFHGTQPTDEQRRNRIWMASWRRGREARLNG